jgi:H+-translocating NAD(P) transhydrogenase subunit alpha
MFTVSFVKEAPGQELRCALTPSNVKQYRLNGINVIAQSGIGGRIGICDSDYEAAGAQITQSTKTLYTAADLIASFHPISREKHGLLTKRQSKTISFFDPFHDSSYISSMQEHGVTAISVEMIPRSSRCQKMDALSSQASLAGYVMVMQAFNHLQSIAPMMMTPSGTIKPAKVFIIGAGVAGLQAIATAKRLGAQVTAFDTRPVVAEQVESLGGKFLKIDLGDTGQNEQGYANELTQEQIRIQQKAQEHCIAESDIVITTAQLFGRKPPRLINKSTIDKMKPGSVIVDMAAESGGNVEGSIAGQLSNVNGVQIIGYGNWSNFVAKDASQMYANNIQNFILDFWDKDNSQFNFDINNEILSSCVITHQGRVVNRMIEKHINKEN